MSCTQSVDLSQLPSDTDVLCANYGQRLCVPFTEEKRFLASVRRERAIKLALMAMRAPKSVDSANRAGVKGKR